MRSLFPILTILICLGCVSENRNPNTDIPSGLPLGFKEKLDTLKTNKSQIYVSSVNTTLDSAGGASLTIVFYNISGKSIKHIYFTVSPFNGANEKAFSEIGGTSTMTLQATGNLYSVETTNYKGFHSFSWNKLWYNGSIVRTVISEIKIVFMDDTTANISDEKTLSEIVNRY